MENSISSDLIRGNIDTIILYTIKNEEMFPQQIIDFVLKKSENQYELNQATLYSSLKRLENTKFVTSFWRDFNDGRRKFYKITDLGYNFLNSNIEKYNSSKEIINKLIDISEKTIKTETLEAKNGNFSDINTAKIDSKNQEKIENIIENKEELNFRQILSDLVENSRKNTSESSNIEPINLTNNEEIPEETTFSFDNAIESPINEDGNGFNDYSDIIKNSEEKGLKIKVYSKENVSIKGILVNKLKMISSLIIYLIFLIEYLVFSIIFKDVFSFNNALQICLPIIFFAFPIYTIINFKLNPNKCIPRFNKDSVLTSLIITINLILVILAINLILNVDLSNKSDLLLKFISPSVLIFDVLIYYIVKSKVSKNKAVKNI